MLKPLRLGADLMAIFPNSMCGVFFTPTAKSLDLAALNTQLQKALGNQNWEGAIKIVDQMIAVTPVQEQQQHSQLEMYRVRVQSRLQLRAKASAHFF